jgi:hypothetical protein
LAINQFEESPVRAVGAGERLISVEQASTAAPPPLLRRLANKKESIYIARQGGWMGKGTVR